MNSLFRIVYRWLLTCSTIGRISPEHQGQDRYIYIQESISPFISLDGKIVSLEINTVFFFFFF